MLKAMLRAAMLAAALYAAPAAAQAINHTCNVKEVWHTRFGVLVHCDATFPAKIASGATENVDWFAPDASGFPSQNGVPTKMTLAETMLGFEEVALEAFRSKAKLIVTFDPGARPGSLYECHNVNCRLARAWAVSR